MTIKLEANARSIAAHVLERVAHEQAFAAAVLDAAIERYPELDPRERGLATELAYGALRTAPHIEARLSKYAKRGLDKLDDAVRAHLFIAGYQILFLDRVPAFAAVSEAVRQITAIRGKTLGSFANAVLRRLSEEPMLDKAAAQVQAIRASAAPWLREALQRALGEEGADRFLQAGAPALSLRVRVGRDRDAEMARLQTLLSAHGGAVEKGRASPLAVLMRGGSDPRRLAPYREGELTLHEEGAQVIALLLGAKPGERVLDACAGRGNKTALLAELVGETGAVDAADQHPAKLERLVSELRRLHLAPHATYAVDWTVGTGEAPDDYDRVLVDAPCSGIGTLRRRPELAARRDLASLSELAALQSEIVVRAASRLREGGALIYAVCSVLIEESEQVVEQVLARTPWLRSSPFPDGPLRELAGGANQLRLTPHDHGTDGYFIASFVRVRNG